MSLDDAQQAGPTRSCSSRRLRVPFGLLGLIGFVVTGFLLRQDYREAEYRKSRERMNDEIAKIEQGKSVCLVSPDPRFLEDLVTEHPSCVAKTTRVQLLEIDVSDKRFCRLTQFSNLKDIYFRDVSGADTFLKHIQGMPSVESLWFFGTSVSDEGFRAAAKLPHLKQLVIDSWSARATLKPLREHPSLETIELIGTPATEEWKAVFSTMPKLKKVETRQDYD
jgi:hypothetical protein